MRAVAILGSTGSIGTQALDVVRRNPDRFKVVGLAAATSHELLVGQIREFLPPLVAIADEEAAAEIKAGLGALRGVEILAGTEAAETHRARVRGRHGPERDGRRRRAGAVARRPPVGQVAGARQQGVADRRRRARHGPGEGRARPADPGRLRSTRRWRSACAASARRTSSASSSPRRAARSASGAARSCPRPPSRRRSPTPRGRWAPRSPSTRPRS